MSNVFCLLSSRFAVRVSRPSLAVSLLLFASALSSSAFAKTEISEIRIDGQTTSANVGAAPVVSYKLVSDFSGGCQSCLEGSLLLLEENEQWPSRVWTMPIFFNEHGLMSEFVLTNHPLRSATKYALELRVLDPTGHRSETKRVTFVTTLLETNAWDAAKFISPDGPAPAFPKNGERATVGATAEFAREVVAAKDVRRAYFYTTGLGVYEAFVNGKPVKGGFLKPGFTSEKCRHVYGAEVTELVNRRKGAKSLLSAEVSTGWYADRIGGGLGKRSAFCGVFVFKYADGTEERIPTDASWKAAYAGPVVRSGIYYGETYDARRSDAYKTDAAASASWSAAVVNGDFKGERRPVPGAIVHRRDDLTLKPVSAYVWRGTEGASDAAFGRAKKVRTCRPGEPMTFAKGETLVIDFGQNTAAVPSFDFAADAGVELTVRFGEMLNDANGEKGRGNDGPGGSVYLANMRSCPSRLDYTFRGGAATYSPAHTFWGYRYLSLTATGAVTVKTVASVPVTSVAQADETGTLVTGDADVNKLVSNVRWGLRSNYLSVPTDCPQRDERMGWTADTQVFTETACYFADVRAFFNKWLADLRDCQRPDGGYPSVAPTAHFGNEASRLGWADAGVIVPWTVWRMTGSVKVLEDGWDSMVRFVDEIAARKYVAATNDSQYADWLSFEKWETCRDNLWSTKDPEVRRWWAFLGGCYWLWDAERMAEIGRFLEKPDAARFARMAEEARAYVRQAFLTADGDLIEPFRGQQTAHLFAIRLGLAPTEAAKKTLCDRLVSLIEKNGNRLSTGFLGTSILMDTITYDVGRPDLAYTLLLQHECPSWLYSVDQGATTIWERWNSYTKKSGFGPVSMNSFNHYAYGAVAAWLFKTAAGIQNDARAPGFRYAILKPSPDRRLGSIDATCNTVYGLVRSVWRYEGRKWIWDFEVPPDAVAEVHVPGEFMPRHCDSGKHHVEVVSD